MTPMDQILSGWKEIANYLGKRIRTVQRYEREMSLPTHRRSALAGVNQILRNLGLLDNP